MKLLIKLIPLGCLTSLMFHIGGVRLINTYPITGSVISSIGFGGMIFFAILVLIKNKIK